MSIRGSCLCGSVKLEVSPPYRRTTHCHCGMCRKGHGSAFASYLAIRQDNLSFLTSDATVTAYQSSDNVERRFCSKCGSNLLFVPKGSEWMAIAMGILDDEPGATPTAHLHYDSRPEWSDIPDDAKVFAGASVSSKPNSDT